MPPPPPVISCYGFVACALPPRRPPPHVLHAALEDPAYRPLHSHGPGAHAAARFVVRQALRQGLRAFLPPPVMGGARTASLMIAMEADGVGAVQDVASPLSGSCQSPTDMPIPVVCGPDAPPPFGVCAASQRGTETTGCRFVLVCDVPVPVPVRSAAGNAAAAEAVGDAARPTVLGFCVLNGQRVRTAASFLSFACTTFARELAMRPPPKGLEEVATPSPNNVAGLQELAATPVDPDGAGPALSQRARQLTAASSFVTAVSPTTADPATAAAHRLPHADLAFDNVLRAFAYDQLHCLLSLLAQSQASVAVVAHDPAVATEVAIAAAALMYPLEWAGSVHVAVTTAAEAQQALDAARDSGRHALLAVTRSVVPAILSTGVASLWLADCESGLVAPARAAVPGEDEAELLPHHLDLKDRWKKARAELVASDGRGGSASGAPLSASGSYANVGSDPNFGRGGGASGGGPQSAEVSAMLLAAVDLFVTPLGAFRQSVVPRGVESHVNIASLLYRTLGLSDPSAPGRLLSTAFASSLPVKRWSSEVAVLDQHVSGSRKAASGPTVTRHKLFTFVVRCAERLPDVYPEFVTAQAKKQSASPFGAISAFVKSAKNSVRTSVSGLPTRAPTAIVYVRIRNVYDARGAAGVLAANGSGGVTAEVANTVGLISRSSANASQIAVRPPGLANFAHELPSTRLVFDDVYKRNGHVAAATSTTGRNGGARIAVDVLDGFAEYHLMLGPPAVARDPEHIDMFRRAVAPLVAAGSFAVVSTGTTTPQQGPRPVSPNDWDDVADAPTSFTVTQQQPQARAGFSFGGRNSSGASPPPQSSSPQSSARPSAGFQIPKALKPGQAAGRSVRSVLDLSHMLKRGGGSGDTTPAATSPQRQHPMQQFVDPLAGSGSSSHNAPHGGDGAATATATPPSAPAPQHHRKQSTEDFFSAPPRRPSSAGSSSVTPPPLSPQPPGVHDVSPKAAQGEPPHNVFAVLNASTTSSAAQSPQRASDAASTASVAPRHSQQPSQDIDDFFR